MSTGPLPPIPDKLFFKIGEVCELTDTQPYVLRYWESEFPSLAPAKNSSGQRIYRRRDIETVLHIKQLLYDEGFTIAGAKKKIESEQGGKSDSDKGPQQESFPDDIGTITEPTPAPRIDDRVLREIRSHLAEILTLLNQGDKIP